MNCEEASSCRGTNNISIPSSQSSFCNHLFEQLDMVKERRASMSSSSSSLPSSSLSVGKSSRPDPQSHGLSAADLGTCAKDDVDAPAPAPPMPKMILARTSTTTTADMTDAAAARTPTCADDDDDFRSSFLGGSAFLPAFTAPQARRPNDAAPAGLLRLTKNTSGSIDVNGTASAQLPIFYQGAAAASSTLKSQLLLQGQLVGSSSYGHVSRIASNRRVLSYQDEVNRALTSRHLQVAGTYAPSTTTSFRPCVIQPQAGPAPETECLTVDEIEDIWNANENKSKANVREDPIASPTDLAALEEVLRATPPSDKKCYLEATIRCPSETTDDRKAAFLETDDLDPQAAASRLCAYWDERVDTFGDELAFLPMTLKGAMREDVEHMIHSCPMQRLAKPDLHGRQMTYYDGGRGDTVHGTVQQEHRGIFYQTHTMTLDPAARRRGWVAIVTSKNQTQSNFSWETPPFLEKMYSLVMPIKMRSCHISYPSNGMSLLCHLPLLKGLAKRQDMRWKVYLSSTTNDKLLEQLSAHGIPSSRLPIDLGGELRLDFERFVADYSVVESLREMDETLEKEKEEAAAGGIASTKSSEKSRQPSNNTPPMIPLAVASSSADDTLTVDALTRASVEANTARAHILGRFNSQFLHEARSKGISSSEEDRYSPYYYASSPSSLAGGARVKRGGLGLLASSLSVPALKTFQETSTKPESRNKGLVDDQEGSSKRPSPPPILRSELHNFSDEFQGWMEQLLDDGSDETANENDDDSDSV